MTTKPTRGAVIAAQIICGVDIENTHFRQPTEYGGKTCLGIANLIDDKTGSSESVTALKRALHELSYCRPNKDEELQDAADINGAIELVKYAIQTITGKAVTA